MPASPPSPASPLDAAARARYGRQIRLPEIGEAGQARLCASEIVLRGNGDARNVEASYIARAGLRVIDVATPDAAGHDRDDREYVATLAALGIADPAARDVGAGALRALLAIRSVLAKESPK